MLVFQDIGNNYLEYCDLIIFYLILFFLEFCKPPIFLKFFIFFIKFFIF